MNGLLLSVPFFAIRFVLLSALSRDAVRRAAHFAPMRGAERAAYYIYQAATVGIFLCLAFLTVRASPSPRFCLGCICYILGLCLCAAAIVSFSSPDDAGMNTRGVYRFSRNPMYVAYFACFIGMALLTCSLVLLGIVSIFQISAHWIVLAEERWCLQRFGGAYEQYMQSVRRYI